QEGRKGVVVDLARLAQDGVMATSAVVNSQTLSLRDLTPAVIEFGCGYVLREPQGGGDRAPTVGDPGVDKILSCACSMARADSEARVGVAGAPIIAEMLENACAGPLDRSRQGWITQIGERREELSCETCVNRHQALVLAPDDEVPGGVRRGFSGDVGWRRRGR